MKTRTTAIILGVAALFLMVGYGAAYVIPGPEDWFDGDFRGGGSCGRESGSVYYNGCGENNDYSGECPGYVNGCDGSGDSRICDGRCESGGNCTECERL